MSDMSLQIFQSKGAHNKPELERAETSAEGNLPVLKNRKKVASLHEIIHYDNWIFNLVKAWQHRTIKSVAACEFSCLRYTGSTVNVCWSLYLSFTLRKQTSFTLTLDLLVFNVRPTYIDNVYLYSSEIRLQCCYSPESCAVKMDHHPLGRVEDERVSEFNALQGPAELRTEVGWAGVRSIDVEPQSLFCTCTTDLNTSTVILLMHLNGTTLQAVLKQTLLGVNVKTYRLVPVQTDCRRHTLP